MTALLSLAAAIQALRLWEWRPGTPMAVGGDATFVSAQIRHILERGWYAENPQLGAPFGQNVNWFPYTDVVHFLALRVLGLFSDSPMTVGAVYFVIGFPLAGLTLYWLTRQFGVGRAGSVMAGVLFAVVPGHQLKFGHLWLASYWTVPLGVALVLWVATGRPIFRRPDGVGLNLPGVRTAALHNLRSVAIILVVGLSDVYYIAFTLLLLAAVLIVRYFAGMDPRRVLEAVLVAACVAGVAVAVLLPALLRTRGDVPTGRSPATRLPGESETYAGKFMDLMMPWSEHRIEGLRFLTFAYNVGTDPTVERPALGFVALAGVVGLLWLVAARLIVPKHGRPAELHGVLGALTLVSLALYTTGGLGSFIAMFGTPQIRTWSRLYLYLALFGLFAAGLGVTNLARRHGPRAGLVAAAVLVFVGVLDQTNPAAAPDYTALRTQQEQLTSFTASMETALPAGCAVFQLPVARFPEEPSPGRMSSHDHLLPYLASHDLRWSYGAMKGTTRADWQLALPMGDTPRLLDDLAAAGYCSVEVDRHGYSKGEDPTGQITTVLGAPIAETDDRRLVAYDLSNRRESLASTRGAEWLNRRAERALRPVIVSIGGGQVEREGERPHQWIGPDTDLTVFNMSDRVIPQVRLSMILEGPDESTRTVALLLPDGNRRVVTVSASRPQAVSVTVTAKSGATKIRVLTDGTLVRLNGNEGPVTAAKVAGLQAEADSAEVNVGVLQQLPTPPPPVTTVWPRSGP